MERVLTIKQTEFLTKVVENPTEYLGDMQDHSYRTIHKLVKEILFKESYDDSEQKLLRDLREHYIQKYKKEQIVTTTINYPFIEEQLKKYTNKRFAGGMSGTY
jgi:hypothetical protein